MNMRTWYRVASTIVQIIEAHTRALRCVTVANLRQDLQKVNHGTVGIHTVAPIKLQHMPQLNQIELRV